MTFTFIILVALLLLAGSLFMLAAAVRDGRERERATAAILHDIETRDLRLATRWIG